MLEHKLQDGCMTLKRLIQWSQTTSFILQTNKGMTLKQCANGEAQLVFIKPTKSCMTLRSLYQ